MEDRVWGEGELLGVTGKSVFRLNRNTVTILAYSSAEGEITGSMKSTSCSATSLVVLYICQLGFFMLESSALLVKAMSVHQLLLFLATHCPHDKVWEVTMHEWTLTKTFHITSFAVLHAQTLILAHPAHTTRLKWTVLSPTHTLLLDLSESDALCVCVWERR